LAAVAAAIYGATSFGWRPSAPPAVEDARGVDVGPSVCVTRHVLCGTRPGRAGDPCSCPHLLRGMVPGHIERLGDDGTPPDPLSAEHLYHSLLYAGFYVKGVADIGSQWATRQAQWKNVFTDEAELAETDQFKDPQIKWHQAYFDLAEDEALVVEVTPPECEYWMIALHNHWMETLDYVHHQATLNCHTAQLETDGSVRFVIAHRDPGVANWLDTAGHQRGTVGVRWVGPDVTDILPDTHVVKVSELT